VRVKSPPPDPNMMEDSEVMIIDENAGAADTAPSVQIPDPPSHIFNATQFLTYGIFVHKFFPRTLDIQGISYAKASESLEYNFNIRVEFSKLI